MKHESEGRKRGVKRGSRPPDRAARGRSARARAGISGRQVRRTRRPAGSDHIAPPPPSPPLPPSRSSPPPTTISSDPKHAHPPQTPDDRPKAVAQLWFNAESASWTPEGNALTFTGPSEEVYTTYKNASLAQAFAPGKFGPETQGDAAIIGDGADGQRVGTIVRVSSPVYENGVLKATAVPLKKGEATLLAGGKIDKAINDPNSGISYIGDAPVSLKNVQVIVDSKAPEEQATAKLEGGNRKLRYYGENVAEGAAGAAIGNAVCHGSFACAAVGWSVGVHHDDCTFFFLLSLATHASPAPVTLTHDPHTNPHRAQRRPGRRRRQQQLRQVSGALMDARVAARWPNLTTG